MTRPATRDSTTNASSSDRPLDIVMTSLAARIASGDAETGQVALAVGVGGRVHAFWVQREPDLSANRSVYHRQGSLTMPYRYPLPLTFAP